MLLQRGNKEQLTANFTADEYFSSDELFRGNTHGIDDELIEAGQLLRDIVGVPVFVNSTYRTKAKQNLLVDGLGAKNTAHNDVVSGYPWTHAVDFDSDDKTVDQINDDFLNQGPLFVALIHKGIRRFGVYDHFFHLDTGRKKGTPMNLIFDDPILGQVKYQLWDSRTKKKSIVSTAKNWVFKTYTDEDGSSSAKIAGKRIGLGPIALAIIGFTTYKVITWLFKRKNI